MNQGSVLLYRFSGNALTKRLREREREIEADERDRKKEKEEVEILRKRLLEDNHPDIDDAIAKVGFHAITVVRFDGCCRCQFFSTFVE